MRRKRHDLSLPVMTDSDIIHGMETTEKFSTKINKDVLRKLRDYSASSHKNIALIVSEAVAQYLEGVALRPVFKRAVDEVIAENELLLKELAK